MNCKPGDLAVIISSANEANLGVVVEVLGPWEFNDSPTWAYLGFSWNCRSLGRPIIYWHAWNGWCDHMEVTTSDSSLRPLRGAEIPEAHEVAAHSPRYSINAAPANTLPPRTRVHGREHGDPARLAQWPPDTRRPALLAELLALRNHRAAPEECETIERMDWTLREEKTRCKLKRRAVAALG